MLASGRDKNSCSPASHSMPQSEWSSNQREIHTSAQSDTPAPIMSLSKRSVSPQRAVVEITKPSRKRPKQPSQFPMIRAVVASIGLFCNSFNTTVVLPFISFMVTDFAITPTLSDVGRYSSYLVASFTLGQLISSYHWGSIADKHGRRPVIIGGLAASACAFVMFGYSKTYHMAMFWRFISGLLNAVTSVTKTYVSEITDETNQAQGFAILGVARSLGMIAGPVIGGFLSNPCDKYPTFFQSCDEHSMLKRYPYALPCIIGATIAMSGAILSSIVMEETLKRKPMHVNGRQGQTSWLILFPFPIRMLIRAPIFIFTVIVRSVGRLTSGRRGYAMVETKSPSDSVGDASSSRFWTSAEVKYTPVNRNDDPEKAEKDTSPLLNTSPSSTTSTSSSSHFQPPSILSIIRDKKVALSIALYTFASGIFIQYDELFALWSRLPLSAGGLSFSSSDQGVAFTAGGVFLFVYQMFIFSKVERMLGCLGAFRVGLIVSIPSFFLLPMCTPVYRYITSVWTSGAHDGVTSGLMAPKTSWIIWTFIVVSQLLRTIGGLQSFTTTFIMLTNSVPQHSRGAVNGFAQTLGSIGRMLGIITAGNLFSWSVRGWKKPGAIDHAKNPVHHDDAAGDDHHGIGYWFPFMIAAFIVACAFVVSLWMPESINRRVKDPDQDIHDDDGDDDMVEDVDDDDKAGHPHWTQAASTGAPTGADQSHRNDLSNRPDSVVPTDKVFKAATRPSFPVQTITKWSTSVTDMFSTAFNYKPKNMSKKYEPEISRHSLKDLDTAYTTSFNPNPYRCRPCQMLKTRCMKCRAR